MPRKPPRPCRQPRCPHLTHDTSGYCITHSDKRGEYDRQRGSAGDRGYDHRWKKIRDNYLRRHPLCVECGTLAQMVDHIIPKRQGGGDSTDNLQSLCYRCHAKKTRDEKDSMGETRVFIICGPPGSGKTSYVHSKMRHDDLVVDVDLLFQAVGGGLPMYEKPSSLLPFVCEARDAIYRRLTRSSDVVQAWVIMGGAKADTRNNLRKRLNATVTVLEVNQSECYRRINQDERRKGTWELWKPIVDRWWREYEPCDTDTVIKDREIQ